MAKCPHTMKAEHQGVTYCADCSVVVKRRTVKVPLALLLTIQWTQGRDECPCCYNVNAFGHTANCELGRIIAAAT